jgi:hypothetical protein
MREIYYRICRWIGYVIVFRDYYDVETFTLKRKNSHMALLKYIGKEDEQGRYIRVKEIFQIQIRKVE